MLLESKFLILPHCVLARRRGAWSIAAPLRGTRRVVYNGLGPRSYSSRPSQRRSGGLAGSLSCCARWYGDLL